MHAGSSGRTMRIIALVALIAFGVRPPDAAAEVAPERRPMPAYIFLEMPATPGRGATEWLVFSLSYDADAGSPLDLHGTAATDAVNARGRLVLAKTDRPSPLIATLPYAALEIVETDAARKTLHRLTFRGVRIESIVPDGDESADRVTFTARSVVER